jgi:hypothetical protein
MLFLWAKNSKWTLLQPIFAHTPPKHACYAWAGGTFFSVVLLCQFSVLVGKRFWFYILLMYLEYHTVVVLC